MATPETFFTAHALTWLSLALVQVYCASSAASATRVQSLHTVSVEILHGADTYRPGEQIVHFLHVSGVALDHGNQPASVPGTRKNPDAHSLIRESEFVVQPSTPSVDACATAVQLVHSESLAPHLREIYFPVLH